ncbi:MAG: hypothetical protein AAF557_07645 [Pseudomonadota bacterium]
MPQKDQGKLIAFRADRLGARLVSLINAMRLADDLGVDFRCAWIDTTGVGHVFNDPTEMFDAGFVDRHFLTADQWKKIRPEAENLSGNLQQQPDAVEAILGAGQDMIVGNAFGVIKLKDEDEAEVTERFRTKFDQIPFSAPVAAAMKTLESALAGHTAYHIRRGDLTDDPKAKHKAWAHKVIPNEFYERHMDRALSEANGGAIIFSDDAGSIQHYKTKFPTLKIIDDVIDMAGLTEAQRDLFELFAMSRCKTIIAPPRSAFSSTAADLTGAEKLSITDAMDDDLVDEAHEALYDQLEHTPDSLEGDGHVGQGLAHIANWLEGRGDWARAARLFRLKIAEGLNISFAYPMGMRLHHHAGDIDGVLEIAKIMRERSIMYVKDLATSEMLHGYAHLRAKDTQAAIKHLVNGFWHTPTVPAARAIVPFMLETGVLTPQNFLPMTPTQRLIDRRRGSLKVLLNEYSEVFPPDASVLPKSLPTTDAMVWDWAPLMRSVSFPAVVRQGAVDRAAERLAEIASEGADLADHDSQCAILQAYRGDTDVAAESLTTLAKRKDAGPMTWQRLSHAYWLGRRFRKADSAAEKALALAPDWAALQAWAGMTALRVRDADRALEHLNSAAEAIPGLPSIAYLQAQAFNRLERTDDAIAAVDKAVTLAPLEVEYAMLSAQLLDQAGEADAAIAQLMRLVEVQRAPGKLFLRLIALLEAKGDVVTAEEMQALAQIRLPKHPAFAESPSEETV